MRTRHGTTYTLPAGQTTEQDASNGGSVNSELLSQMLSELTIAETAKSSAPLTDSPSNVAAPVESEDPERSRTSADVVYAPSHVQDVPDANAAAAPPPANLPGVELPSSASQSDGIVHILPPSSNDGEVQHTPPSARRSGVESPSNTHYEDVENNVPRDTRSQTSLSYVDDGFVPATRNSPHYNTEAVRTCRHSPTLLR